MNVGVSGLVVAQHLWRRAIALHYPISHGPVRVLAHDLLRVGGLGAVRMVATPTPPLVPCGLQAWRRGAGLRPATVASKVTTDPQSVGTWMMSYEP